MLSQLVVLGLASAVAAHGTVSGIIADGVYYQGYNPSYQYITPAPVVVGWSIPQDLGNGFVPTTSYGDADIICHLGATNAQTAATVKAGGKVQFNWTPWPVSHKGPMITHLANCNGPCETVDKTTLKFFKIDAVGIIDPTAEADDYWASDVMIANNNTWTSVIPLDLSPGNYVARHETIALHSAQSVGGAQDYPFCVNLKVTGSGTANPAGTLGEALYQQTDPGFVYDIYASPLPTYTTPGPALYSGASSVKQTYQGVPTASSTGTYKKRWEA
ncbi:glycoside hydrolase family 61 protein [Calycina marina]|uniref:Glycoside hydrolase family 61 protein n=1 Tax=Calycina marina TaxID=1763456 RepID=A0A9P8CH48_9HELO|nr:glycoside hydrolase family 61 protein [Calycina marina]